MSAPCPKCGGTNTKGTICSDCAAALLHSSMNDPKVLAACKRISHALTGGDLVTPTHAFYKAVEKEARTGDLGAIRDAFEQIVVDLDSAEDWAKRTNVGHIHGRLDQARMEARTMLERLRAAQVWWKITNPTNVWVNRWWTDDEKAADKWRNTPGYTVTRFLCMEDPEQ